MQPLPAFYCEPTDGLACIACGCTNERACRGGCCWVSHQPPKCSACFDPEGEPLEAVEQRGTGGFFRDELCPASATPALHAPLFLDETSGYCARCLQGFAT